MKLPVHLIAVPVACLVSACAGSGFEYEALPDDPIVFVYRTSEEAETVEDLMKERRKNRYQEYMDEKVRLEDVGRLFGLMDTDEQRAASLLGRLSLLHPATRTRETLAFAGRGTRPLAWSKDHRRLLFTRIAGRDTQVYEWDRDSGEQRPITWGPPHVDGCYGPGDAIAVARVENGSSRIYVVRPGQRPIPATPGPSDSEPAWSADGKTLVYRAFQARRSVLLSVDPNVEDSEPRFLAAGNAPVFTPDGSLVVFVAQTRQGQKLFRMRPDGSGRRPVGESPRQELDPAVSPDGRFVVFVVEDDDRRSLWVRSIEGAGDLPLEVKGDGLIPVW